MPETDRLLNQFILGGVVMASVVAGVFFLRFYRRTADRLFLMFAIAFWVLALNWLMLAFTETDEVRTALYFIRMSAFVLILIAILDKNRRKV